MAQSNSLDKSNSVARPRILVVADKDYAMPAQLELATQLSTDFEFIFLLDRSVGLSQDSKIIDKGFRAIRWFTPQVNALSSVKKAKARVWYKDYSGYQLIAAIAHFVRLKRLYRKVSRLFDDLNPDLILVNSDRGEIGLETATLLVANKRRIPKAMPYSSYISDGISIREGRAEFQMSSTDSLLKKWFFKSHPELTMPAKGRVLTFYTVEKALALLWAGALSRNPWTIGEGLLDCVFVDCSKAKNELERRGSSSRKLVVVGDVSYQELYQSYSEREKLRQRVFAKYSLRNDFLVIVGMPQNYEHGILSREDHFSEVRWMLQSLKEIGASVLISLHPKMKADDYAFCEEEYGYPILRQPLREVLPAANLYLATNSSTVFWAVLCGIPSIILNFHGLAVWPFEPYRSIQIVNSKAQLMGALQSQLRSVIDFESDWEKINRSEVFDGRTREKYLAGIKNLMVRGAPNVN